MGSRKVEAFLFALQLSDSAFPAGRFAHSGGLEAALVITDGIDAGEIVETIRSALELHYAPLEGVALAHSHRAQERGDVDALHALDSSVTRRLAMPGPRLASEMCGQRLALLAESLVDTEFALDVRQGRGIGNAPVVQGSVCCAAGVGLRESVLLELRAAVAGQLSACMRLGYLTASSAQVALLGLGEKITDAAENALSMGVDEMHSSALEFDLWSAWQLQLPQRLFKT